MENLKPLPFGLKWYSIGFEGTELNCTVAAKTKKQAISLMHKRLGVVIHNCEEMIYCKEVK